MVSVAGPISKAALLACLPPEPDEAALFPMIRRLVEQSGRKLVVIDDDPTGVQTVHDVALYLRWDERTLTKALRGDASLFFVLTNSRSLPVEQAVQVNRKTAQLLMRASARTGVPFVIASRSDSTLRGHYPAEVLALQEGMGERCDGHLIVPAFFEGGRLTIGDSHYVATPDASSDTLIPASDTPFAQDQVFGYSTAHLPAWVEEKSGGAFSKEQVVSLSLELIRMGGPQAVAKQLEQVRGGVPVVVNAAGYGDLAVVVLGVLQAEAAGRHFLYRTGASFVRLRGAVKPRLLLSATEMLDGSTHDRHGGLVVVGSYVPGSSAQLERLLALPGVQGVELPVEKGRLGKGSRGSEAELGQALDDIIRAGRVGVLYTSRTQVTGCSAAENVQIGQHVADALVSSVRHVTACPAFVIAKGGITSQVIAQRGLGAQKAFALGQILPGVPVWRLERGPTLRFPGIPYIVFPGNVGGPNSLAEAVDRLRQ